MALPRGTCKVPGPSVPGHPLLSSPKGKAVPLPRAALALPALSPCRGHPDPRAPPVKDGTGWCHKAGFPGSLRGRELRCEGVTQRLQVPRAPRPQGISLPLPSQASACCPTPHDLDLLLPSFLLSQDSLPTPGDGAIERYFLFSSPFHRAPVRLAMCRLAMCPCIVWGWGTPGIFYQECFRAIF